MEIDASNISSGIGTGQAQVFKPYDSSSYFERLGAKKEQQALKKQKQEEGIYKQLAPLDKIDIFFRDQPKFDQLIGDLRKSTRQNIDKLRSGDPEATMNWQNQLQDIFNEANLSKNTREQYEKVGNIVAQNPDKYDPDTQTYLSDFADKNNIGNYNFDPTKIVQYVDLGSDIKSNVTINPTSTGYEFIDETGNKIKGSGKIVTQDDADKVLEQRFFSNPVVHTSAMKQYERARRDGTTTAPDAITYYKQIGRPYLVKKETDYSNLPTSDGKKGYSFGNGQASNDQYNFVYSSEQENPNKTTYGVTSTEGGGKKIVKTGSQQLPIKGGKVEEISIASINNPENNPLYMPEGDKQIKITPLKLQNLGDGKWKLIGSDVDGKTKEFDLDKIKGKFEANYFINPYDLIQNIGGGGTMKTNSNTSSSSNSGSGSYSIKGKTYTLKQLQDMGYTEEQVAPYKK